MSEVIALPVTTSFAQQTSSAIKTTDAYQKVETGENWEGTLRSLQDEVWKVLGKVEKDKVQVDVGRTAIHKDRAVILSWSQRSRHLSNHPNGLNGEKGDGVLLYLAIRFKKEDGETQTEEEAPAPPPPTVVVNDLNNNSEAKEGQTVPNDEVVRTDAEAGEDSERDSNDDGENSDSASVTSVRASGKHSEKNNNEEEENSDGASVTSVRAAVGKNSRQDGNEDGEDSDNASISSVRATGNTSDTESEAIISDVIAKTGASKDNNDQNEQAAVSSEDEGVKITDFSITTNEGASDSKSSDETSGYDTNDEETKKAPTLTPAIVTIAKMVAHSWHQDVTLQRGVDGENLKSMFVDDKYRHRDQIPEDMLMSELGGEGSSSPSSDQETRKKKSVRWKEELEEDSPKSDNEDVRLSRRNLKSSRGARRRHHSLDSGGSPTRRLYRSRSYQQQAEEYDGPVGVLTSRLPEIDDGASSSKYRAVPEARNLVRRIRSCHVRLPDEMWFVGDNERSFNSRCSARYRTEDFDENSKHYYFYQTLPRVSDNQFLSKRGGSELPT